MRMISGTKRKVWLRWRGHLRRRNEVYLGRKVEMDVPGQRRRRETEKEIYGHGKERHDGSWSDKRYKGQSFTLFLH